MSKFKDIKHNLKYGKYENDKLPDNVKNRCCNYPLLEEKCLEYNKKNFKY